MLDWIVRFILALFVAGLAFVIIWLMVDALITYVKKEFKRIIHGR